MIIAPSLRLLCVAVCCCASALAQPTNLYDRAHTLQYGEHLLKAGEFELAAQEYERLVFSDSTDEAARLCLLRSYRLAGKFQQAETRFHALYSNELAVSAPVASEYAKLLLQGENVLRARNFIAKATLPDSLRPLLGASLALMTADWQAARSALAAAPDTALAWHRTFRAITAEGEAIRYKKPLLAATFSAIVPGSGKIYAGAWKDGLFSMVLIGLTSWQSYRAFHKSGTGSVYGWTYAGLATGLYIGNVWGAAKAAHTHNNRLKQTILQRVRYEIRHLL